MGFMELLKSLTHDERKFIAERDYGVDADVHLHELNKLIDVQSGALQEGQYWYPYEVIELTTNSLVPGHEREFVACTLLILHAVASGYDTAANLDWKFNDHAVDYDLLPPDMRDMVLSAFMRASGQVGE